MLFDSPRLANSLAQPQARAVGGEPCLWDGFFTCAPSLLEYLVFAGGFTSYLTAMDWNSYAQVDGSASGAVVGKPPAVLPPDVVQPRFWHTVAFMLAIYFTGKST